MPATDLLGTPESPHGLRVRLALDSANLEAALEPARLAARALLAVLEEPRATAAEIAVSARNIEKAATVLWQSAARVVEDEIGLG